MGKLKLQDILTPSIKKHVDAQIQKLAGDSTTARETLKSFFKEEDIRYMNNNVILQTARHLVAKEAVAHALTNIIEFQLEEIEKLKGGLQ